jgi:hypothetical protein
MLRFGKTKSFAHGIHRHIESLRRFRKSLIEEVSQAVFLQNTTWRLD